MIFRRRRNIALLVVLALVPVLIAVAVKVSGSNGPGDSIFGSITENGLFAALAALLAILPLFLPLAVSVVAGDSVAGEANLGTLRYLLAVPVDRTRLLAVKFAGIVAWCAAAVVTVAVSGSIIGAILYPTGRMTLLSGRTISFGEGLWRLALISLYVIACVVMVGAVGLFVSTMTEVPIAAMAATLVLTIVSEVLDQVPQLHAIHGWLPSHYWLNWIDLLRDPVNASGIGTGLLVTGAYVAVALSLAWARFTGADVTA
jgi:ABC-2 type transport system permease protein